MITLAYELSAQWKENLGSKDLSLLDESFLLYHGFLGDIVFLVDDVDFSARWGWVPILDFARNFFLAVNELKNQSHSSFEFTESDAVINLKRDGNFITVYSNYTNNSSKVFFEDLSSQAHLFAKKVFSELASNYPQLTENPAFITYQTEIG